MFPIKRADRVDDDSGTYRTISIIDEAIVAVSLKQDVQSDDESLLETEKTEVMSGCRKEDIESIQLKLA